MISHRISRSGKKTIRWTSDLDVGVKHSIIAPTKRMQRVRLCLTV